MKNIAIMGDSYSTFDGSIPQGYLSYYPKLDVQTKEDTWWDKMVGKTGVNLVLNDSWSGSTICYTGWRKEDCSQTSSFICRYRKLKAAGFFQQNEIDTLFVFGGTNDSWADSPLGEMMLSGWSETDLYNVLPAICYLISILKEDMPQLNVVFIINSGLKEEIVQCIKRAAVYYGISAISLGEIQKENGHPTAQGMTDICNELISSLENNM
jgi:hypothetical protein